MDNRFYMCLILLVSITFTEKNSAQDSLKTSLTFDQAVELTFQQSHVVKQSNYFKEQKEQELKAAKGINYPNISLSANYVYMAEDIHLDLNPVKDAITPLYEGLSNFGMFSGVPNPAGGLLPDEMSTQYMRGQYTEGLAAIEAGEWEQIIQKQQFATVNLNATLPIYTGGKISAKKNAAKLGIEEAELESKSKNNELTTELVERYFGLCLARQAEEVRKEVLQAMQEHLGDARKMKNQGMIANAELLHAKVYFSEAERELKKAERFSIITNRALLNTLCDSAYREVYPISNLFYLEELEPLTYFQEEAVKNNPSLKKVASKKSLAEIGVKVQTGNYLPIVAVMGTYDLWNYDLSPYLPHWMVGVGLKWTIFDGFVRERNRKSAKLKVAQVEEFEQKASKDVQTGVEKYYQELQMSLEQIKDLETAQEFTEEYFRVRQKAFHEGMATSTDVVDANLALVKVKIERLQAAYQFDVSLAKLLEICGLSEKFATYQTSDKAKVETFDN
jgi:outer membrane protein TolC